MGFKILLIEDVADFRDVFKHWLEAEGFEVVCSLERSEIESLVPVVDLVVCDYDFSPSLTFWQVAEIVGQSKPLILCSGVEREGWACQVTKPDAVKDLRPLIKTLLKIAS